MLSTNILFAPSKEIEDSPRFWIVIPDSSYLISQWNLDSGLPGFQWDQPQDSGLHTHFTSKHFLDPRIRISWLWDRIKDIYRRALRSERLEQAVSFHWWQSTKKVVKNFLTTVWRRIQSRKITIHLEKCPSLRSWIRKTPNTKKTTPPPHVRHKECGRSDLRKTYKAKTVDAIKNFWTQSRLVCSRDLREYKTVTNWQSPFPSDVY